MAPVVLVTGCSEGGIGFALCQEFIARGCKVYATARRTEAMAALDGATAKLALDVTSDEQVPDIVQHIVDAEGRIDIVVNNAGSIAAGPLIDISIEHAKATFDANTFSVLRVCKAVIPHMAKRKSGLIVNIGSVVGEIPTAWNGLYASTKAALGSISDVLHMECQPLGVKIMHVSPGAVQSNIAKNQEAVFTLPEDSLYGSYLPSIIARIHTSQGKSRMSTDEFARRVVGRALSRSPPRYMTLGGHAWTFAVLKWLPRAWALAFLWYIHSRKRA